MMTVERRYAMTRLGAGDYVLPANDGRTLFRICRYQESSVVYIDAHGREREDRGWYWSVARYALGTIEDAYRDPDFLDWDVDWMRPRWFQIGSAFRTRQDAIDYALER